MVFSLQSEGKETKVKGSDRLLFIMKSKKFFTKQKVKMGKSIRSKEISIRRKLKVYKQMNEYKEIQKWKETETE